MQDALARFWSDEAAVTSIEYGLIAALIAILVIVGASNIGDWGAEIFQKVSDCLATPTGAGC